MKLDRVTFLGATYLVGLFLVGLAMITGRFVHLDVIITLVVEITLLYISVFRPPLKTRQIGIMVLLAVVYYPLSVIIGIFSDMVIVAVGGVAIYVAMTVRVGHHPTKALLAGLFSAGLFFTIYLMIQGFGLRPDIVMSLTIHTVLLYMSLMKRPPDKKELAAISALIVICFALSVLFAFFSLIVIWTLGSLTFYGLVRVEPKFPLTKRAMGTGLIVGVVMTFMGIYLALKIGIVFLVGAEMLGAIFLGIKGKYTREENAVAVTIANTSSMVAIGVLLTYPAIAIFDPSNPLFNTSHAAYDPVTTLVFIMFTTGISAIFGIIVLAPFRRRFENEPWPRVQPQAECINSIGSDSEARKAVGIGLGASGAWVGGTKIVETIAGRSMSTVPNALAPVIPAVTAIPDWIGISNSPMIAGIGFFVGWKRSLVMVLGSVISIAIWIVIEGANGSILYTTHLKRPEILYLVLGVFITVILADVVGTKEEKNLTPKEIQEKFTHSDSDEIIVETPHKTEELTKLVRVSGELFSIETIKEDFRQIIENPREFLRTRRGQIPLWISFVSMGLFIIVGLIVFWFVKPFMETPGTPLEIHWLLIIFGTPLSLVSAYFTARAISETGMLAGYISDIIAVPAILFFRVTFGAITTFMGMLGAIQDAAIALLVHLKLGRLTGVRGRDILKAVFIGSVLGTTVGSVITFEIFSSYGFGTVDFPSPAAQLFGFLVLSLQGIGDLQLPGLSALENLPPAIAFSYLIAWGGAGFLAGRELNKRGLSPISLVVGVLIPPATSVTILIGGYISYRTKQIREPIPFTDHLPQQVEVFNTDYSRTSRILSGVVAGEAVVTVVWVLLSVLGII
ncbi:MAG: OPT/YSL family transporter [Candidatus Thorarchaeota archaeon]